MAVKIRLARFGKAHAPFYNIVVANARTARNSKPLEVLGTYDPIPKPPPYGQGKPFKDIQLDTARAKYWLGVGAQPSDPVWRLLAMVSLYYSETEEAVLPIKVGLIEPKYSIIEALQQKAGPIMAQPGTPPKTTATTT
ncbi:37S ribosomal protein S16, mitochondrial [Ptychographa xylographoides]|nr:37S ribosomal protein S16, mitochondrial [Ptychographa xylographoides]